ncbi:uncharacterized protein TNCV_3976531 [Trichonephila clavipes]|nr:uncharacterized protein TNCV_3976531 [Trichonephila clavipes]
MYHHVILSLGKSPTEDVKAAHPKNHTTALSTAVKANHSRLRDGCSGATDIGFLSVLSSDAVLIGLVRVLWPPRAAKVGHDFRVPTRVGATPFHPFAMAGGPTNCHLLGMLKVMEMHIKPNEGVLINIALHDKAIAIAGKSKGTSDWVNIKVTLFSYSRVFGYGPRRFEPWSSDEDDT